MNKITFYEQVGIVIPGSVFMFGLLLFFPALQTVLTKDGVNLGDFGIFLLLSYAAGHLIAATGNAAENVLWPLVGGMPTDWITRTDATLLSTPQIDLLEKKLESHLGITQKVRGLDPKLWRPISRQIYADVAKNGKPDVCSRVCRSHTLEMVGRTWTSCADGRLRLPSLSFRCVLWTRAFSSVPRTEGRREERLKREGQRRVTGNGVAPIWKRRHGGANRKNLCMKQLTWNVGLSRVITAAAARRGLDT